MSAGSTFRRCSCRDEATGRSFGSSCPKLSQRRHGTWAYRIELPAAADGTRRPRRRGSFTKETDAQAELDHANALLNIADKGDEDTARQIGDLIEKAIKTKQKLPDVEEVRKRLKANIPVLKDLPTVGEWLDQWLPSRKVAKNTVRSYESHIRLYLKPALGAIRLDRLRSTQIKEMFDAIEEHTGRILEARGSDNPIVCASVKGQRTVGAASMQRIRATLRKAFNDAIREYQPILTVNPAKFVELPAGRRPKALVWTPARVQRWHETGEIPSPVMVWTPEHTGVFLDYAVHDPLYPLFHLVAFRGLRRGEACGAHWTELDVEAATLTVSCQLLQLGWEVSLEQPKTEGSDALVALDSATVAVLVLHKQRQDGDRVALGAAWPNTGLMFTKPDGQPLHPADVTDRFKELADAAGLPPIRLHDLRHGAATLALAAGTDMKVVQAMLRHSSLAITSDTYTSVLPEVAHRAAEAAVPLVPRQRT